MLLFNYKLELLNTIMIVVIIMFLIIFFITNYFKSIENFNQYGFIACPPLFTKKEKNGKVNIYWDQGTLGIGTNDPLTFYNLDVKGKVRVVGEIHIAGTNFSSFICHSDGHTYIRSSKTNHKVFINDTGGVTMIGRDGGSGVGCHVNGELQVSGNTNLTGNLNVGGSFMVGGNTISTYSDSNVESKLASGLSGEIKFTKKGRTDTTLYQTTWRPWGQWWSTYDKFVIKMSRDGSEDCSIEMYDDNDIKFSNQDSDERIKTNIIKVNDNTQYMQYLRKCNMYKYNFKTKLDRNSEDILEDGFIAQEVENIIPKAVTKRTGIIKDINTKCSIMNDVLELDISGKINYNIKENDVLQLIDDNSDSIKLTIKQIIGNNKYTIHQSEEIDYEKNYKVIGYIVDDLRNLDHNVLTRISIGAIKHVDNEVTKLKEIIKKQQEQIEKQHEQIEILIKAINR